MVGLEKQVLSVGPVKLVLVVVLVKQVNPE